MLVNSDVSYIGDGQPEGPKEKKTVYHPPSPPPHSPRSHPRNIIAHYQEKTVGMQVYLGCGYEVDLELWCRDHKWTMTILLPLT